MMEKEIYLRAENIVKTFSVPGGSFTALKDVSLNVPEGAFVILKGRSGSGKTTLMNILSSLDDPTSGEVFIKDRPLKQLNEKEREVLRRKEFGFVFQSVSLLPSLNAFQNVEFSMRMAGLKIGNDTNKRVEECLSFVGLSNRALHMPQEMSGGEQQRVAIARSFAHRPRMIFADEPTAELDSQMAARVASLFSEMSKKENITVFMITHDMGLLDAADMVIELENGVKISG